MSERLKFRLFLLYKLPIAFLAGLRLVKIDDGRAEIRVKHSWLNQNPFRSMYFAVQAMAAEISTGLMVFRKIKQSGKSISMLVTNQDAVFTKKATGWNFFKCEDGKLISEAIDRAVETREGQTVWVTSRAHNAKGDMVSEFRFQWSIRERD
jgi:high-affinity nickel permease